MNFKNIAKLIREKRLKKKLTQGQLGAMLGYPSAQFVSNIERGLCGYPAKKVGKLVKLLDVLPEEIKAAMIKDYSGKLDGVMYE